MRDLKVTNTDYTSITLAWMKPDSNEGGPAKGYKVEKKSSDSLKWTHCNTVPIGLTTCTIKGLQAREMYFLRVRAINEGGLGEAIALDTCIQAMPPIGESNVLPLKSCHSPTGTNHGLSIQRQLSLC